MAVCDGTSDRFGADGEGNELFRNTSVEELQCIAEQVILLLCSFGPLTHHSSTTMLNLTEVTPQSRLSARERFKSDAEGAVESTIE